MSTRSALIHFRPVPDDQNSVRTLVQVARPMSQCTTKRFIRPSNTAHNTLLNRDDVLLLDPQREHQSPALLLEPHLPYRHRIMEGHTHWLVTTVPSIDDLLAHDEAVAPDAPFFCHWDTAQILSLEELAQQYEDQTIILYRRVIGSFTHTP